MTNQPAARTLTVPGDHPTLAAALAAAQPGDTVMLMESLCEPAPVRCVDGVTIEAVAGVVLRGKGPVLVAERCKAVRIFGLQFAHDGTSGAGGVPLCEVRAATVEMRHCTFAGGRGHGLLATQGAKLRLKRCAFVQNTGDGLHLEGAGVHAEVMDCSAADNTGDGVRAVADADGYIERLVARGNRSGISAAGSRVTCRAGVIEANRAAGVAAARGAVVRLEANTISGNAGHGVEASGAQTNLVARRNVVACNTGDGFSIRPGATTMLDGNTCGGNGGAGVSLTGPEMQVEIFANECTDNARGIIATGEVAGQMEDNVCRANSAGDFVVGARALRLIRNRVGGGLESRGEPVALPAAR